MKEVREHQLRSVGALYATNENCFALSRHDVILCETRPQAPCGQPA